MSETLLNPYFGEFGGMYVPEILVPVLQQLEKAFVEAKDDPEFQREFQDLLKNYAGRPTALTLCRNLTKGTKAKIYLKREDLLHGGAHKTNQVLGQILLAKRMGKTRIIAETGAGQHGCFHSWLTNHALLHSMHLSMSKSLFEQESLLRPLNAYGIRLVIDVLHLSPPYKHGKAYLTLHKQELLLHHVGRHRFRR